MLEHLFGSKTRLKLLQAFYCNPDKPYYVRELARFINTQLNAVRREIANLEKLGIIEHVEQERDKNSLKRTERSKFYKLRTDSLLFNELKNLLSKAQVLEEKELIEQVRQKGGKIKLFILSGVFTQSKDAPTDILLVGDIKPVVINRIFNKFEEVLNSAIRYTIMNEQEYLERKEIGDKFLYNILESDSVIAIDELSGSNL